MLWYWEFTRESMNKWMERSWEHFTSWSISATHNAEETWTACTLAQMTSCSAGKLLSDVYASRMFTRADPEGISHLVLLWLLKMPQLKEQSSKNIKKVFHLSGTWLICRFAFYDLTQTHFNWIPERFLWTLKFTWTCHDIQWHTTLQIRKRSIAKHLAMRKERRPVPSGFSVLVWITFSIYIKVFSNQLRNQNLISKSRV